MKRAAFAVISPHRDDAALSLGGFLGRMAARRVPFGIVNCFTISEWSPYRAGLSRDEVTRTRRREDRCFGRCLRHAPMWRDLCGLDAPLRLGPSVEILGCTDDAVRAIDIEWLVRSLRTAVHADVVLAPLALGRHVDHLVARHAAVAARNGTSFAFYEDIPYAGAIDDDQRAAIIDDARRELDRPLRAIGVPGRFSDKLAIARIYRSQVGDEEIAELRAAVARLGGERLWADDAAHARLMPLLANCHPEPRRRRRISSDADDLGRDPSLRSG